MDREQLQSTRRRRWFAALVVGSVLWLTATVLSQVVPSVVLAVTLVGSAFATVALLQLVFGPLAVWSGLLIAGRTLGDAGLRTEGWRNDALIGFAVAAVFASLQFLLILPATGGAERSDVLANTAQIGETFGGLLAFVGLAWAGALSEELYFRGLLLNALRGVLGASRLGLFLASVIVVLVFAGLHGYQGWVGVIDTGLYGGATMTVLYLWRGGRLTACIVAHAAWNTIATVVLWACY